MRGPLSRDAPPSGARGELVRSRVPATALQAYVVLGAAFSLLGWIADVPAFADWDGDGITIQPNACVAAICAGLAVASLAWGRARLALWLGGIVAALGSATLFQYATGISLGIDELLMFGRTWGRVGVIAPGRMGPPGATSWTVLGVAIVLAARARSGSSTRAWASGLALTTTAASTLSLLGYLYGASALYSIPTLTVIAKQTATFVFCASLGLVMSVPERGSMRLFADPGPSGILARRLLPAIVVLPVLVGLLRVGGVRAGLYDAEFGTALRTIVEIGLLLLCVWWCAEAIRRQTQRREESDAALRSVTQHAQVGLVIVDGTHRYLYANPSYAAVLGLDERAIVGRHVSDVLGAAYAEQIRARLEQAFSGARVQHELSLASGATARWFSVKYEPQADERGAVTSVVVAVVDVTHQKEIETAREQVYEREREARAEAERAVRVKDEFLATLSHELRTPLNAMLGWAQILRHDALDPALVRAAADVIERNGRAQAQLITDLLDMSRIMSGKMRLDVQVVDLEHSVGSAIESMTPAAQAKGVAIERSTVPVRIQGDPDRLQQVVWNLLSNAVKFTPRGGCVRVELSCSATHAELRVSDTGDGIAPEFLPHLFERFRQADASTSRPHGGLGIGLALVKQLTELHGGCIRATSAGRGLGATFVVELPLHDDASEPDPRDARALATSDAGPRPPASLKGLVILVVDAEDDALAVARHLLEACGAEVVTAQSAAEALTRMGERAFDVLISDLGMPGTDGHALLRALRARGDTTPAVALSAFAGARDRATSQASGFRVHLAKPVDGDELVRAVASLAGRAADASAST